MIQRPRHIPPQNRPSPPLLNLRYLPHADINQERWDQAVAADPGNLPYGFSWWLNAVTDERWDGMVLDDYRVVLPLPVKRSFGPLRQIHRAPFTQQSGPFGDLQAGDCSAVLSHLPRTILAFGLPLSATINSEEIPVNFTGRQRTNLTLDLSPDYPALVTGFGKTLRKKLRRYPAPTLAPARVDTVLEVYRNSSGKRSGLNDTHYRQIRNLMAACRARGAGHLYRLDGAKGLLAAGFFPEYRGRIINLFAGATVQGFREDGMARLLAGVIQQHRGTEKLLDFEGSDIPGVRDFFQAFGARNMPYSAIKRKGIFG